MQIGIPSFSFSHKEGQTEYEKRVVQLTRFLTFVALSVGLLLVDYRLSLVFIASTTTLIWACNPNLNDYFDGTFDDGFHIVFAWMWGVVSLCATVFSLTIYPADEIPTYWAMNWILIPISIFWCVSIFLALCKAFLKS